MRRKWARADDGVPARPRAEDRAAIQAAEKAIANPLLDEIQPARLPRCVLINITGGHDLTLFRTWTRREPASAKKSPRREYYRLGSTLDTELGGVMRVRLFADRYRLRLTLNTEMPVPRRSIVASRCQPETLEVEQSPSHRDACTTCFAKRIRRRAASTVASRRPVFPARWFSLTTATKTNASNADASSPPCLTVRALRLFRPRHEELVNVDAQPARKPFVAPTSRVLHRRHPIAEALARLRAARFRKRRQPSSNNRNAPASGTSPRQSASANLPRPIRRKRFGINSVINRHDRHV